MDQYHLPSRVHSTPYVFGPIISAKGTFVAARANTLIDFEDDLTANVTVAMPRSPRKSDTVEVKAPSNLGGFTITLDGVGRNIDDAATFVMNTGDMFLSAYFNGTRWRVRQ